MINEVDIFKCIKFKQGLEEKIGINLNYKIDVLQARYGSIVNGLNELSLKKKELWETLIEFHVWFVDIMSINYAMKKKIGYATRKGYLQSDNIDFSYNSVWSTENLLKQLIIVVRDMVSEQRFKNDCNKILAIIEASMFHGHYLLNLSQNKTRHSIKDVSKHLWYMHQIIKMVYYKIILNTLNFLRSHDTLRLN